MSKVISRSRLTSHAIPHKNLQAHLSLLFQPAHSPGSHRIHKCGLTSMNCVYRNRIFSIYSRCNIYRVYTVSSLLLFCFVHSSVLFLFQISSTLKIFAGQLSRVLDLSSVWLTFPYINSWRQIQCLWKNTFFLKHHSCLKKVLKEHSYHQKL